MISTSVKQQFLDQDGNVRRVLFANDQGVLLRTIDESGSERQTHLSREKFNRAIRTFTLTPKLTESPHKQLLPYQQEFKDRILPYLTVLKELVDQNWKPCKQSSYKTCIELVVQRHPHLHGARHPGRSTLLHHWKNWRESNFNELALGCKRRSSKGVSRLNPASEALLQQHLALVYLHSVSRNISANYRSYQRAAVDARNANRSIVVASPRTFSRRVEELSKIEKTLNNPNITQGERNKQQLVLMSKINTTHILQRVECDAMHVNMCLICDLTGRPTPPIKIYVAFDVHSRAPLSVIVGFGHEKKEDVLNLLRQTWMQDENLPFSGKAIDLVMDNGAAFNNPEVKKLCERMNVNLIYNPSNQPSRKPFVERFYGTLRKTFFEGAEIICSSQPTAKVGFDSYAGKRTNKNSIEVESLERIANIKVSDFKQLLTQFFVEYVHKEHSQLNMAPIERWRESQIEVPQPIFDYENNQEVFHVLLDCYSRNTNKLQSCGLVKCNKQQFSNRASKELFDNIQVNACRGATPEVHLYYDPFDCRSVTISAEIPSSVQKKEVKVTNTRFSDLDSPISFAQANGEEDLSFGVLGESRYEPTGNYSFKIDDYVKRSRNRRRNSLPTKSFEANNHEGLTAAQRIKLANASRQNALADSLTSKADKQYNSYETGEAPFSMHTSENIPTRKRNNKEEDEPLW